MTSDNMDYITIALPKGNYLAFPLICWPRQAIQLRILVKNLASWLLLMRKRKSDLSLARQQMYQPMWNTVQLILVSSARMF